MKTESWVIGKGNIGQTGTLTLGTYASEVTNAALIVGRGTAANARLNGLVVLKDGTVQIPSGNLILGSEPALTATSVGGYLSSNHYVTRAMGTSASVSNGGVVAFGDAAVASGLYSAAIGGDVTASGLCSFAAGGTNVASGERSTVMGGWSQATGDFSFAAGIYAVASARESFAIGSVVSAEAQGAIVLGCYSKATAHSAVALGRANEALNEGTLAAGIGTRATAYGSTVLGSKNIGIGGGGWNESNPVLEVGNAFPWGETRSNAITTLVNGQTKLTNKWWSASSPKAVPTETYTSAGEALVVEGHTVLKGNTKLAGKVTLEEAQGDISMGIYQ